MFKEIETVLGGLDNQINTMMKTSQFTFFKAFKEAMSKINEDIRVLKDKTTTEHLRKKTDKEFAIV